MGRLAYLGPEGTFSEEAAIRWSKRRGGSWEVLALADIGEVAAAVREGRADQGILPLENSIEGAVNVTMDLLREGPGPTMVGEVVLDINHNLLVRAQPGGPPPLRDLAEIRAVYSHSQALAQCSRFLKENLAGAQARPTVSTAEAARLVASGPPHWAAIGSLWAARRYGLTVLASNLQDYQANQTRFAVIGAGGLPPSGCDRTSLVLALAADRPGGLYEVLREFADEGINLSRIESRPTKEQLGKYFFYIDCEGHYRDPALSRVLTRLADRVSFLKLLGSYPRDSGQGGEGNVPGGRT